MRTWHAMHRLTPQAWNLQHVIQFGLRVGYWPCLKAPFVQLAFGKHLFDLWYGSPSYKGSTSYHSMSYDRAFWEEAKMRLTDSFVPRIVAEAPLEVWWFEKASGVYGKTSVLTPRVSQLWDAYALLRELAQA